MLPARNVLKLLLVVKSLGLTLLLACNARADIVIQAPPPWDPSFGVNWGILFVALVLATIARLTLLGLRALWRRVRRRHQPSPAGRPEASRRRGIVAFALLTLAIYGAYHVAMRISIRQNRVQRGKQSEAKSNLGAIRSTEVAYFAEWDFYVGNQPLTPPRGRDDLGKKLPWDATTRFSILGFAPEGNVFCSYSLSGADYPSGTEGFTATAECDYDEDRGIRVSTVTNRSSEMTLTWREKK